MKPKHTPGPWTAVTDGDTHPSVIGPDGKSIFSTANARSKLYAENCANVILAAKVFEYQDLLRQAENLLWLADGAFTKNHAMDFGQLSLLAGRIKEALA